MSIKRVAQEDADGCAIACVAMVLGWTYQEARGYLRIAAEDDAGVLHGIHSGVVQEALAQHGWMCRVHYRHNSVTKSDRAEWPPPPFAPVHIAFVNVPNNHHAVVVTATGDVLDPNSTARTRLTDFSKVDQVIGFWKVPQ